MVFVPADEFGKGIDEPFVRFVGKLLADNSQKVFQEEIIDLAVRLK